MDERVIKFIKSHHLLSLALYSRGEIWSWNSFYHYLEKERLFLVASERGSRHIEMLSNEREAIVAGTIAVESEKIRELEGIQFTATIRASSGALISRDRISYLKRFPYALLKRAEIWRVEPIEIKYSSNREFFGEKLYWRAKD